MARSQGTGIPTTPDGQLVADVALVGDANGDGRDEPFRYDSTAGEWWVDLSAGSNFSPERWADFYTASGWSAQLVGDFNGDGRDDIANFHPSNGSWWGVAVDW